MKELRQQQVIVVEEKLCVIQRIIEAGADVSPAMRYRLEGYLTALIALDVVSAQALQVLWRSILHERASLQVAANNQVSISILMPRAPVYPSTKT
ncbi:hypothetical protein EDC56_1844 [Sinobacterium caligoides]|uniref:Uncharacterized protein n=1 Tax=Sinobacterium caligoides TaxID=933926 RepID=A0A3N2DNM2_9GAMM|nr:hypothetical protein [Sinobacterium caligoides]ROS01403.1 hypothetical protein EDC56_1844 [Sinobacterium caligoides]